MRTITVTSGKGGVGKTTVACNLAVSLAQLGMRPVLFDADLQLANVDVALGITSPYNLQHVVAGERTLAEILAPGPAGIKVISGGSAIPALMSAGPKKLGLFIDQLVDLAPSHDILIFDTAAGLDSRVITFMKLSQEIILVTTPDPTSVTDAYATIKTAHRRLKNPDIRVIVNQVSGEREGRQVFDVLQSITHSYLGKNLSYVGSVRQDFQAAQSIRKRRPVVLSAPNSWSAQDIKDLARMLRSEATVANRWSA